MILVAISTSKKYSCFTRDGIAEGRRVGDVLLIKLEGRPDGAFDGDSVTGCSTTAYNWEALII